MGGDGNFSFNLAVKLFVECFSKFEVINSFTSLQ
jgi:hypothetical protein